MSKLQNKTYIFLKYKQKKKKKLQKALKIKKQKNAYIRPVKTTKKLKTKK